MTEPRIIFESDGDDLVETADVICGEPGAEDDIGTVVTAEETGGSLNDAFFAAEREPTPDLDPARDLAALEAADRLQADGTEPEIAGVLQ